MSEYLQTEAWQSFQTSLGRQVFVREGKGWRYMAILECGTGNTRLYCPHGPEYDDQQAFEAALDSLKELGRELKVSFLRVEPAEQITEAYLRKLGLRRVTYSQLQPARTQIITLVGRTEDQVLADMVPSTRNRYRNYQKKGMEIHESSDPADVEIFLRFIKKVAHRTQMVPHTDSYFRKQAQTLFPIGAAKLFYVTIDGVPAAASIAFDSETTRYYAHAAADDEYRRLAPGTVLVAYMIIDAYRAGKQYFDLYGIAPPDQPRHPWAGFTLFKQQFGGEPVQYVGTWDLPIVPLRYHSYRTYQTVRHVARKQLRTTIAGLRHVRATTTKSKSHTR